ncbi:hypothetical protein ES703_66282 [subsurface metagenome]
MRMLRCYWLIPPQHPKDGELLPVVAHLVLYPLPGMPLGRSDGKSSISLPVGWG